MPRRSRLVPFVPLAALAAATSLLIGAPRAALAQDDAPRGPAAATPAGLSDAEAKALLRDVFGPFVGGTWHGEELAEDGTVRITGDVAFRWALGGRAIHEVARIATRVDPVRGMNSMRFETVHLVPAGGHTIETWSFDGSGGLTRARVVKAEDGWIDFLPVDVPEDGLNMRSRVRIDGDRLEMRTEAEQRGAWTVMGRLRGDRTAEGTVADVLEGTGAPGGDLLPLRRLLGAWETTGTWHTGDALWARNEFRSGAGGAVVVNDTWAGDGGGDPYHRYLTIIRPDPIDGRPEFVGFTFDGTVDRQHASMEAGRFGPTLVSEWTMGEPPNAVDLRQRVAQTGPDAYDWNVWGRTSGEETAWEVWMDTTYRRVDTPSPARGPEGAAGAGQEQAMNERPDAARPLASAEAALAPIDSSLFEEAGDQPRGFTVEETIAASPKAVFDAWTTAEGLRAVMDLKADVDLRIGGRYHWLFLAGSGAPAGEQGSEGCQVLAYLPGRMLAFSWSAPPTQPEIRKRRTWVVLELEPVDGGAATKAVLTHLGFGEGPKWDANEAYFRSAWPQVLGAMRAHFAD